MSGFPSRPETMDAGWLAQALGRPADALAGFTARPVGTGQMCDSFRLTLDWRDRGDAPASIIAKCPSLDPASRSIAQQLGSYMLEVRWYRDVAADVPISVPRCSFADIAEDRIEFLLLLEDLAPARQGDQLAGADADAIAACVKQAAHLHAALWNDPRLPGMTWLQKDNRPMIRAAFPALYQAFRERYTGRLDADCLDVGARLVERLEGYMGRTPAAQCLTHGDMRVDNILFGARPDPATPPPCWMVDWQTLGIGTGASDIAYLLGTSIADPQARAALDRPMFDLWIDALCDAGVAPDAAALWDDYRVGALSGYFMAVFASMNVERTERGDEMFAVMAERPARQALALGSLDLI
jgi:hypothetical protein